MAFAFFLVASLLAATNACPATSTTAATPCPTHSTCPPSQSCAAVACPSGNICSTSGQFPLCTVTTTGTGPVAVATKFCLSIPGSACTALGGTAASPAASYDTFALCCAQTTTTAANIKYDIVPTSPNPQTACFGTADGTKAYVGCSPSTKGKAYCVRFPSTCAAADNIATTALSNTDFVGSVFTFSSYAACCTAAAGAAQAAKLSTPLATYYGLTTAVETCLQNT